MKKAQWRKGLKKAEGREVWVSKDCTHKNTVHLTDEGNLRCQVTKNGP